MPGKKEGGGRKGSIRRRPESRVSIFEMSYFLKPVSLLQVYFVLNVWTSQGLYLHQAQFLQDLILTRFSSLLNYKFFQPTLPERLVEPCNAAGGSML